MSEEILGETVFNNMEDAAGYVYYFTQFFTFLGIDGTPWISRFTVSLCQGCLTVQKFIYNRQIKRLCNKFLIVLGIFLLLTLVIFIVK